MASKPIRIAFIGDDSQLKKTLKQTSKRLEGFGKSVAKVGATAGLAFAGAAASIGVAGVTAFSSFEKNLKEVMTLLPDAGKEVFDELSEQTKSFAKEFGVLPDKALPALYSALSAGVPRENVFTFMEVAQKAAKGGVTELETAVDALSSVVNAYGSANISATESSDLLLSAVRLGKTTFEELAAEIYKVAPIAASVGVPFENLTASIAVLTSQGVPTAQSATMLKGALAELAKEGTKADTAFREFAGEGLAAFLEGGGTFEEAIMGLAASADASGKSVLDLFGSVEAGQAILSLTADGGVAFGAVLDEMGNSAGATEAAFATMNTGLSANFDRIKANLAVLAIDIGEKLAPYVVQATDALIVLFDKLGPFIEKAKVAVQEWATEFTERVTPAVDKFVEVAKKVVDWVRTFIKENPHSALAALGVLIAAVVTPVVAGLVLAFGALFSPVVLVVAAIAALAAGAVYAYENFEGFRNVVDTVRDWMVNTLWPALKWVAEKIVEGFQAMVSYFQTNFLTHVQAVVDAIKVAWQAVADFFMEYLWPTIKVILGYITDGFRALVSYFRNTFLIHVEAVATAIVAAWQAVADFFMEHLWPTIRAVIGYIVDGFKAMVSYFRTNFLVHVAAVAAALVIAWQAVSNFFMTYLWPTIKVILGYILQAFWYVLRFFQNDFIPIVRTVVETLVRYWQTVANFFMTYLWPTIRVILGYILEGFWIVLNFFQDDFLPIMKAVLDGLIAAFQAVWDFIKDPFLPFIKTAAETITTVFTTLADFFTTYVWPIIGAAFANIMSIVRNLWDVIVSVYDLVKALFSGDFKAVWVKFRDMIGEVIGFVVDLFIKLPMKIWNAAKPLVGKFALIVSDFAVHLLGKIVKLIQAIPDQIVEFISGIAEDMLNIGKDIGRWIIDGLVNAIKAAASAVADAVKSIIPDVGGIAGDVAGSVGGWFKSAIPGLQHGGVVTSPTLALIGEAGPEAVIPLDRLHGGGGTTFNITVNAGMGTDGRQVGNQIVAALKSWERTNGSLPLSVSAV